MKKVFLDDLPRRGKFIDWKNSIGYIIKFIYEDNFNNRIEGELEIIDYFKINNKVFHLNLKYKNNITSISADNFKKCKIGYLLGIKTKNYFYSINDIIETKFSKIKIIDQIRIPHRKYSDKGYKYECLNCGNIDTIFENSLNRGIGCNVCCYPSLKVLKGYNDIATTNKEIVNLMKFPDNGYNLSFGSGKLEIFVCPDCGYEKEYKICDIINYKFSCPRCSDGISYPNKFAFNLFEQLNINFIPEYNPDWIKPRRYDFYFELLNNKKYILEMDGRLGHGYDNNLSGQTPEESKAIDDYKDKMAKENGIEVIRIDCVKGNLEYIKDSIINSKLNSLFNLNDIDWLKCDEFACSTRVFEASEYYNNGKTIKEISSIMKLNTGTITKYLNISTKLNKCNYNGKESKKITSRINGLNNGKPVIQLSLNGEYISMYPSVAEAERITGIFSTNISNCCLGKYRYSGGFRWMFKDEYIHNINNIRSIPLYKSSNKSIKKVVQLNLKDSTFIKEYESIAEASRQTGISTSNISTCCRRKTKYSGGFKWMFKDDYDNNINNLDFLNNKEIIIVQLDLKWNLIKIYNNILEAINETGIKRENILNCCNRRVKISGGYRWLFKDDYDNKEFLLNIIEKTQENNVIQLSLNNEFICEYNNVFEAQNINYILHIYECCKGLQKSAGGFKWVYRKNYIKYIEEQYNIV